MQQSSGLWEPKRLQQQPVSSRLEHDSQAACQLPPPPCTQWRFFFKHVSSQHPWQFKTFKWIICIWFLKCKWRTDFEIYFVVPHFSLLSLLLWLSNGGIKKEMGAALIYICDQHFDVLPSIVCHNALILCYCCSEHLRLCGLLWLWGQRVRLWSLLLETLMKMSLNRCKADGDYCSSLKHPIHVPWVSSYPS